MNFKVVRFVFFQNTRTVTRLQRVASRGRINKLSKKQRSVLFDLSNKLLMRVKEVMSEGGAGISMLTP